MTKQQGSGVRPAEDMAVKQMMFCGWLLQVVLPSSTIFTQARTRVLSCEERESGGVALTGS
jgi:hypothetical protein